MEGKSSPYKFGTPEKVSLGTRKGLPPCPASLAQVPSKDIWQHGVGPFSWAFSRMNLALEPGGWRDPKGWGEEKAGGNLTMGDVPVQRVIVGKETAPNRSRSGPK